MNDRPEREPRAVFLLWAILLMFFYGLDGLLTNFDRLITNFDILIIFGSLFVLILLDIRNSKYSPNQQTE
ncbi:MAG: hypothetical protein ACXAC7_19890 [Candidatus Hodarchaeales archaeon]|jgi:hypothetical protein